MSIDSPSDLEPQGRDWRLHFSLGLTIVWLLLGFAYISGVVGWTDFVRQNAPSLGSFLEGAFAPLAFLWLVVGFFLQQKQLTENTRTIQMQLAEMRRTAEQAEIQSRAIAADELHSRQDTFMRVVEMVREQLGNLGGFIVTSHLEGGGETGELWTAVGQGDSGVFSRRIIGWCWAGEVSPRELFVRYGGPRQAQPSSSSAPSRGWRASAAQCDPDGMISEALQDSPHGRVYRFMVEQPPRSGRGVDPERDSSREVSETPSPSSSRAVKGFLRSAVPGAYSPRCASAGSA